MTAVRILAVDTATEACSAALWLHGSILLREAEFERGHAERILTMVDELLIEAALPLSSLDAIAFGRGPGSFTGVRLAASVTQGLAYGADLPVIGVSDLRAVAQRVLADDPGAAQVLVCNDARMQEVYWGCFQAGAERVAEVVGLEHVAKPAEVTLPEAWSGAVHGAGRGFAAYPELKAQFAGRLTSLYDRVLPRATEIARLGVAEFLAGRAVAAQEAIPVYLRDKVARPQT